MQMSSLTYMSRIERNYLYQQSRSHGETLAAPKSQVCVRVNSSAYGMFQFEPATLGPNHSMVHVAPSIVGPSKAQVFVILIRNISTTYRQLPKHVVLATGLDPPPFVVGIDIDEDNTATISNRSDSTIAAVYYKPNKNQSE